MKILFLFIALPDLGKDRNMYSDLIEEFIRNGHEVYPVAPAAGKQASRISEENGMRILRVRTMRLFNVDPIRKGIANILLPGQFLAAIRKYYAGIKFDLVVTATPPITFARIIRQIKRQCGAKFYLILRDIFPQNAVDLRMFSKRNPVYHLFRRQERRLYASADRIGCMSQGNIVYVEAHNPEIDPDKLHILENFQRPESEIDPDPDPMLLDRYGLNGKFLVVFGGNMGVPQQLENVLALAKECEEFEDVIFLLIGKGTEQEKLKKQVAESEIRNVRIYDFMPHADYQRLVALCDVGLISLNEKFTIPNIPSKTLSYFNLKIPVLASVDKCTDYGAMLDEAGAGLWSIAGDVVAYKKNFDILYHSVDLRKQMGENGRMYFDRHLTPSVAYQTIMKHVQALF